jgi:carbon-monoxide dehydrogenase medium subunit
VTRAPDLVRPSSLQEATELLRLFGDGAKVVGGSTAMTIMLRQKLIAPDELVPIGHLTGLGGIEVSDGAVRIGALVTHRQVELDPDVNASIPVLAQTFGSVANVRIRNAATVGGVLAEADYASDPPGVLLGLDATVHCVSPDGARVIPIGELFRSFYETTLSHDEIITAVEVPLPAPATSSVYNKYVSRAAEDRPCVGVFASAHRVDSGFDRVRVVVGAAAETPYRAPEVEALADGTTLDDAVIARVADAYAEGIDALEDMRGTAWYRREMVRVWVTRSLQQVRDDRRRSA